MKIRSMLLAALLLAFGASAADAQTPAKPKHQGAKSDVIWRIVHEKCVPNQAATGNPTPCAYVSPPGGAAGYAVLKDLDGPAQFLLIPTEKVTGIESPLLLDGHHDGYWAAAWDARRFLEDKMGGKVPDDGIGLAVNSVLGRSQNQLHIHIDCVRPDVVQALKASGDKPGWGDIVLPPAAHHYAIRQLTGEAFAHANPFALVAAQGPDVGDNMAIQTIAVIGATFGDGQRGFYLLNDRASRSGQDAGAAEELLDQSCAVVK